MSYSLSLRVAGCFFFFFFKQKTAYEIGLGIPAEPLFRSHSVDRFVIVSIFIPKLRLILILNSFLGSSDSLVFSELFHSLAPRDFIGIRVNRAKKSGMVNITSSVNSRERSGINTILHELNPLFTINVTMRDIKSKNVYSRVNSKATTQWRKTESANGVHLEGVASDNRSS